MKRHQSDVSTWMTTPVITIRAYESLFNAYNLMFENDVRRLPVVDSQDHLVGMLTMSDILQTVPFAPSDEEEGDQPSRLLIKLQTVADIMSCDPITITAEESVQEAAERMLEYKVSGLPVIEGESVVGIITESDIFRLVVESWTKDGMKTLAHSVA
jgi:acetoin utilization protein AcuB